MSVVGSLLPAMKQRCVVAGSSLRVRNYRLYFIGQSVSVAGSFMQTLAAAFLTLELTGSGTALGIVTAARMLPFVLLAPIGGVIADRSDKRRLLFFTQTASALISLMFAILTWAGVMNYPLLIILNLMLGCFTVFDNPARQSLIPELVSRDELANAVVLNSVSMNIARILGSVLGGTFVAILGAAGCFFVNALSFGAVIFSLALMDLDEIVTSPQIERAAGQVREGLRYVSRTPDLAVPLLMITITGILAFEFPTTLPLLATYTFGGNAATYGLMAAMMSCGAIIGGFMAAGHSEQMQPRNLAWACVGWGAAILLAGLAPNLLTVCIALMFVGYGSITFNSIAKTSLQLASRPEFRGRVMALWALAWIGSSVIGAPLVGWAAEAFGSRWGLLIGAVPTILLGLAFLPYMRRRS